MCPCVLNRFWTIQFMTFNPVHASNYSWSKSTWLFWGDSERKRLCAFFPFFLFQGTQIFSTISTAFLNPFTRETQSAAYAVFWMNKGIPQRSRNSLFPAVSWGMVGGNGESGPPHITDRGSFGGSGWKMISPALLSSGVIVRIDSVTDYPREEQQRADCVCCLFSPLAFLAWCNWHRAYWSGNYCNARDSLGQRG